MKILVFILIILFFWQSYLSNELYRKNSATDRKYNDILSTIETYEGKKLEILNQLKVLQNKDLIAQKNLNQLKMKYTELMTKNNLIQDRVDRLKEKNISQDIIIKQKDNEILILKNELLKYIAE